MDGEDHEASVAGNTKYCLRTAGFPTLAYPISQGIDELGYLRIICGRDRPTRNFVLSAAEAEIADSV